MIETVAELVKRLLELPQDKKIMVYDTMGGISMPVMSVDIVEDSDRVVIFPWD